MFCRIVPFARAGRKLAVHPFAELRRLSQVIQAAPVFAACFRFGTLVAIGVLEKVTSVVLWLRKTEREDVDVDATMIAGD